MKYISTRGGINPVEFSDAVLMGLASDGGLLIPECIPDASRLLNAWKDLTFAELAEEIMLLFVDIPRSKLRAIIQSSYSGFSHPDITPVLPVGNIHVLELFHGPTLSFKDIALQFLGNLFESILDARGGCLNIVGATSGDTGSAAIAGMKGKKNIRIFIMHPAGKTSRVQELQMTTVLDANVFNIALHGDFDDCQRILKGLFNDLEFKQNYSLASVNSINWARILAQIVYYFYSAFKVMAETSSEKVSFSVPTGNFGDIFAGYMASCMGLPVSKLVLATNENDILCSFFNSGVYSRGRVKPTISPSMDIQVASNFERYLYYKLGSEAELLTEAMSGFDQSGEIRVPFSDDCVDPLFDAGSANTQETLETISKCYNEFGYLLDPHSAVGVHVASRFIEQEIPMICLATAHPAKFSKAIKDAVGRDIAHHPSIDFLEQLPVKSDSLPVSEDAVKNYIAERVHNEKNK